MGGGRDEKRGLNEETGRIRLSDFEDELTTPSVVAVPDDVPPELPPDEELYRTVVDEGPVATEMVAAKRAAAAGPRGTAVPVFRLRFVGGAREGEVWESRGDRCAVGYHPLNDVILDDPTVSRFHCEISMTASGPRIFDLRSCNGTTVDGVSVCDAYLRDGSLVRVGQALLRFELGEAHHRMPISASDRFGTLVSISTAMRTAFALLERAASSDSTVLLEGGTGTGKGAAAESLHRASARADSPFVVIDCSAISKSLLESELFGHARGAYTGADTHRIGAFEESSGGSVFLDEIGELPLELQPSLLRVLENREVRRVGENKFRPVDVRVIAATNRDLRAEVNDGRFRSDLYYRLAVLRVRMPLLRERTEDIPLLARSILCSLGATEPEIESLLTPALQETLRHCEWPGNVRELRNYLEQCLVLDNAVPMEHEAFSQALAPRADVVDVVDIDVDVPFSDARREAIARFEEQFVRSLLERHEGKVTQAARATGLGRVHLYRLMRKYGLH